jgi:hypothetical protein
MDTKLEPIAANATHLCAWDLDEMVDRVWRALHKEVEQSIIRRTLHDILLDYEHVTIQTYVSIFACRQAVEALRKNHGIP